MAQQTPVRVLETSTTTGTGTYTLAGAVTGFQTFTAGGLANADTTYYYAEEVDANGVPSGGWEFGIGTWATGGTLARTTVIKSSNANAAVSWAAGTRRIGACLPSFMGAASNTLTAGFNSSGAPSVAGSGAGATALGGSYASGQDSFAAGNGSNTSSYGAQGTNSLAIGFHAKATGTSSLALGGVSGSTLTASATYSVAIGVSSAGNASQAVTGSGAMALGGSYASGAGSFAAAVSDNTGSYGSLGASSVAVGSTCTSSGQYAFTAGNSATASAQGAIAVGEGVTASGLNSVALGAYAKAAQAGKFAHATYLFAALGDAQYGLIVLSRASTGSAVVLTSTQGAASTTNQLVVATNQAMTFTGMLIGKQSGSANIASYTFTGSIVNVAGTVTVVSTLTAVGTPPVSWTAPTLTADNTNKALAVTSGFLAATNINWVCTIQSAEIIFA